MISDVIKLYRWKYHNVIGSGIDEKKPRVNGSRIAEHIAVYVAAELMKNLRESWREIDEKHRVSGSGIDENHLEIWSGIDEVKVSRY